VCTQERNLSSVVTVLKRLHKTRIRGPMRGLTLKNARTSALGKLVTNRSKRLLNLERMRGKDEFP